MVTMVLEICVIHKIRGFISATVSTNCSCGTKENIIVFSYPSSIIGNIVCAQRILGGNSFNNLLKCGVLRSPHNQ